MQYIEFNVQHQVITRTDEFEVVANSQNYLSARFTFSEEWAELQQTAVFSTNGGAAISVLIQDGECVVPWEVLRGREFWVGVFAGDRITSNLVRVAVDASVRLNASPGVQPTPSAYELLVGRVEEALRKGPKIGDNENWWVWDATVGDFVDTGVYSHGSSPRIGDNGNWWIGNDDTGVRAAAADGKDGTDGKDGKDGKDGNSIQSIARTAGTGAPGTTDTYTVTLTDGSQTTFNVYNGADGLGAGDMTAIVYDPQGKKTDVFKAIEDAVSGIDAGPHAITHAAGGSDPITPAMIGAVSLENKGLQFTNYGLAGVNFDEVINHSYCVGITEDGFGTRPSDSWANVMTFTSYHFTTQIAISCTPGAVADRLSRMWIREKYNETGSVWSAWREIYHTGNLPVEAATAELID